MSDLMYELVATIGDGLQNMPSLSESSVTQDFYLIESGLLEPHKKRKMSII